MDEAIVVYRRQLIQKQGGVFVGNVHPANGLDAFIDNQAVPFLLGDGQRFFIHQVKEGVCSGNVLPPVHHTLELRKLGAVVTVGLLEVAGFADAVYLREVGCYI